MAIEAISNNDVARMYKAPDVNTTVAKPEFMTAEAVQPEINTQNTKKDRDEEEKDNLYKSSTPSDGTIKQAISDINKKINPNTIAEYGFHEETKRVTIKIVDKDTDKTIKEFPAEETLDMIAKVWELAGMFLDEKG